MSEKACPVCSRELWTHTREERAECEAQLGGFAIVCRSDGTSARIPLRELDREATASGQTPPDGTPTRALEGWSNDG